LPYNPTAENLAKHLLEQVCPQLLAGTGVRATKVVIWETDEACAAAGCDSREA
jgi:6-pyruvoyltetrahydropterin/6-carboxytetrahydropterin synthase